MVEGAPLLREYTGNGIEGSNPFLSAIISQQEIARDQGQRVVEGEGEIGLSVALEVGLDERRAWTLRKPEFAGLAAEGACADEFEGLVSGLSQIGIERGQVHPVAL